MDFNHLLSIRWKFIDAKAVFLRHNHLQQANSEPLHVREADAALEDRVLHALAEPLADLRDLAQPSSALLRLRVHIVSDENIHGKDYLGMNGG